MRLALLSIPLLFVACAPPDTDGDGITDEEEANLGTNPNKADSDGDGVKDAGEEDLGTDPLVADTDGDGLTDGQEKDLGSDGTMEDTDADGYTDYEESLAGSSPIDAASLIYTGHWPFNPNKDSIVPGDPSARIISGSSVVPRFKLIDQFGDEVDLYDFAQQGKPMIIDLSGSWCYYCNEVAKMIEGRRSYFDSYSSSYDWVEGLGPAVEEGKIFWITILDADVDGSAATPQTATDWYEEYPMAQIPVLADQTGEVTSWINPRGYPTMMFVDENMVVSVFNNNDYTQAFDAAMEYANAN